MTTHAEKFSRLPAGKHAVLQSSNAAQGKYFRGGHPAPSESKCKNKCVRKKCVRGARWSLAMAQLMARYASMAIITAVPVSVPRSRLV